MKDICVDLDIAKELKEKEYPQKGNFAFFDIDGNILLESHGAKKYVIAFAPCTDELLKELPKIIIQKYTRYDIRISHHVDQHLNKYYTIDFTCRYVKMSEEHPNTYVEFSDEKLCNAIAKMYIWLKEKDI